LALLAPQWRPAQLDLAGAAMALVLLILSLPWRLKQAWGCVTPWRTLGVATAPAAGGLAFLRGMLKAMLLLGGVSLVLVISGQAHWLGQLSSAALLNALALALGVGFAEELLFRGWLWGELNGLTSPAVALRLQAGIFALLHPWYLLPPRAAMALLLGLWLLGLVLALQRRADGGLLWGAMGLHGGLVGGWFALQAGLLQISQAAPAWLIGDGGANPNPIAGLLGWMGLGLLLWIRRPFWQG